MKINRIYHRFELWEDYTYNFYGGFKTEYTEEDSVIVLKDLVLFEDLLNQVIGTWKHSCEHNLTNEALNRVAYLGQACMALKFKIPSNKSRNCYNMLTEQEKTEADNLAQKYLDLFLERLNSYE